jgi:hypothetical protein
MDKLFKNLMPGATSPVRRSPTTMAQPAPNPLAGFAQPDSSAQTAKMMFDFLGQQHGIRRQPNLAFDNPVAWIQQAQDFKAAQQNKLAAEGQLAPQYDHAALLNTIGNMKAQQQYENDAAKGAFAPILPNKDPLQAQTEWFDWQSSLPEGDQMNNIEAMQAKQRQLGLDQTQGQAALAMMMVMRDAARRQQAQAAPWPF